MKSDPRQQAEAIFRAALKRDPASRAVFLDGACLDDDELRAEVESLLAAHDNDSLTGQSIGPYKIISRIGAGGMGEVYLAQDTRLGRKVALKLLPDHFVTDKERLNRFNQEARAASALNHPNIITIHEIG